MAFFYFGTLEPWTDGVFLDCLALQHMFKPSGSYMPLFSLGDNSKIELGSLEFWAGWKLGCGLCRVRDTAFVSLTCLMQSPDGPPPSAERVAEHCTCTYHIVSLISGTCLSISTKDDDVIASRISVNKREGRS